MTHAPAREDPVVATLSEAIGGPIGQHARPGRRWLRPVAVLMILAAVVFGLGMVKSTSCYQQNWTGNNTYQHFCYSDLPYLYTARGFAEHDWPYTSDPQVIARYPQAMEYPVGISYWAWGASWVTHWLVGSPDLSQRYLTPVSELSSAPGVMHEVRVFVVVNAIGFGLVTIISAGLLGGVVRRRPWDAAAFALSPALLMSGLINWDLLAVGFVAGALFAWSRGRPMLTGALIGLGTATKLYPLLLLGGLFVICVRRRKLGDFFAAAAAGLLAWVVANLPAYISSPDRWKVFWTFNSSRPADLGSPWQALQQITNHTFTAHAINVGSWVFFAAWCIGVLVVGLRAPETPRLAQLGFLIVTGFLLINKVYSPQYVLWLLPLAVLARPRWRDQLIWQGAEVLYFCMVWWYLADKLQAGDGTSPFYWVSIGIRMAAQIYLVVLVVRDMYRPWKDPVRSAEYDAPEPALAAALS